MKIFESRAEQQRQQRQSLAIDAALPMAIQVIDHLAEGNEPPIPLQFGKVRGLRDIGELRDFLITVGEGTVKLLRHHPDGRHLELKLESSLIASTHSVELEPRYSEIIINRTGPVVILGARAVAESLVDPGVLG